MQNLQTLSFDQNWIFNWTTDFFLTLVIFEVVPFQICQRNFLKRDFYFDLCIATKLLKLHWHDFRWPRD